MLRTTFAILPLLVLWIFFTGCATHPPPSANIDRTLSPEDLTSQGSITEATETEEEEWTPPPRNLMADIPRAYRDAVRQQFGNALEATPILDWYDHGMEAYQEGRYKEAERSLKKVLEEMPGFLPVLYNLGLTYYYQEQYTESIDTFEQLIEQINKTGVDDVSLLLNPDILHDAYINLGMAYYKAGDFGKAIPMFMKVMPDETAHYNLVSVYYSMKDYPKVVTLVTEFIEKYGQDAQLYNLQGLAHYHQEQYDQALRAFEQAVQIDSEDAQIQLNVGLLYIRLQQYAKAEAAFRKAKELDPEVNVDEYVNLVQRVDKREGRIHYNRAVQFHKDGKIDAAIVEWKKAIELDPEFIEAHINLAAVYSAQGRQGDAITHLDQATQLDRTSFEAYYNLGLAYFKVRRYKDAIEALQHATKLNPDHAEAQFNLGMALYRNKQPEEAIEPLRKTIQLKPTWLEPRKNLGLILGHLRRFDEGIDVFKELLKFHPRNSDAYYNLGVLHFKNGNREDAIAALENAIRYDMMNTKAHAMLEQLTQ